MPTELFILFIAPNSEMMLKETDKSLPSITVKSPLDNDDIKTELEKYLIDNNLKKELINYNYSNFKICDQTSKSIILKVSDSEKVKINNLNTYKFFKTSEIKENTNTTLQNFFKESQYSTQKDGNPLDKCIKDAPEPPKPSSSSDTETIIYKFYRPIFPLRLRPVPEPFFSFLTFPNNPIYPTLSPYVVSPFVSPYSSPRINRPYNTFQRDSSPIVDRRFEKKRTSPVVPRSSLMMPRIHQSSRVKNGGDYYEKYMKYKEKYIQLKNQLK
jgi:hypothetical protein